MPCRSALQRHTASGKTDSSDTEEHDKPVVYSTSKAAEWKAAQTFRSPIADDVPAAQRWSVLLSISVFLIYFLVLREENDLDAHLARPITDTVPDLEKIYGKPAPVPREWVPPAWRD